MYKVICVILSVFMPLLSLFGYAPDKRDMSETIMIAEKDFRKSGQSQVVLDFEKTDINTVEVELTKKGRAEIVITAGDETVYTRIGTEKYRFCAFKTINTNTVTVKISGESLIKSVKLSHKSSNDRNFRVTAYIANGYGADINNLSPDYFDVITDMIVIGNCNFDEQGILSADEEILKNSVDNIKTASEDKDVKIYLNIIGPGAKNGSTWEEQMDDQAKRHSAAMKNKELAQNIVSLVEKYNFDGFFFDYEYPMKAKYWKDIASFLKQIDKISDTKIGLAVADWNMSVINKDIVDIVDMFEFMQYDLFDEYGEHASFDTAVSCVDTAKDMFIPKAKVDMGLPFYGRPADRGGYWPSYSEYAEVLGTADGAETDKGTAYFNCSQTVYDKTAYALDKELGGMMVWHYACDIKDINNELSLFGTMKRCIEDRVK